MKSPKERILIFDTTLRDGEQSPGCSMDVHEKILVAKQLELLGVDKIEAGFPVSSPGDFAAVRAVAEELSKPIVVGLCRATDNDIQTAWDAVKVAKHPGLHTFIATSEIHMQYKLRKTREEVLKSVVEAVSACRSLSSSVEFSAEDASRSDPAFLAEVFSAAIEAGADTINIPDTVGYTTPQEYARLMQYLKEHVKGIEKAIMSVHCHNDLGMAVANSIAAVHSGARQIECTINGIGERAGNTALEEVVMILNVRNDFYPYYTGIDTSQLYPTSRLVSQVTGVNLQPHKAIVGANAFAHESGIHQDGFLKEPSTYEIMTPEAVGMSQSNLVLGKHSGKHALKKRLENLGYPLGEDDLARVFGRFKEISDKKKEIYDADLAAIVLEEIYRFKVPERYKLKNITVSSGTVAMPCATVQLEVDGEIIQEAYFGNGPVDALFKTIINMTGFRAELNRFTVSSITGGTDAQGEVSVELKDRDKTAVGHGSDPDILVAGAKALVNAINRLEFLNTKTTQAPL